VTGTAFTTYAVLVLQSLDAAQADTELFSYLPSGGARPVKTDDGVKFLGEETVQRTPESSFLVVSSPAPSKVARLVRTHARKTLYQRHRAGTSALGARHPGFTAKVTYALRGLHDACRAGRSSGVTLAVA
jgi:hypothetical protein